VVLTVARRSPLPRRPTHDDSRTLRGESRGGHVYVPDLPGWYANLPGWHSARRWLAVVERWSRSRSGRRTCERHQVEPDTLVAIAGHLARYADHDSGRRCAPSQQTVADASHCARKTVQRAEKALAAAGLLTLVHGTGLYTGAMYKQYRRLRQSGQRLALPRFCVRVRALTLPRAIVVSNVPLPAEGRFGSLSLSTQYVPSARPARRKTRKTAAKRRGRPPRPLNLQRLAARLVARLPWLGRNRHIGRICDVLSWAEIRPERWTAETLLAQLAGELPIPTGTSCRSPVGWLITALERVDPDAETPVERARRIRQSELEDQAVDDQARAAASAAAVPLDESSAAEAIRQTLRSLQQNRHR
jgi:hypothetical protein